MIISFNGSFNKFDFALIKSFSSVIFFSINLTAENTGLKFIYFIVMPAINVRTLAITARIKKVIFCNIDHHKNAEAYKINSIN